MVIINAEGTWKKSIPSGRGREGLMEDKNCRNKGSEVWTCLAQEAASLVRPLCSAWKKGGVQGWGQQQCVCSPRETQTAPQSSKLLGPNGTSVRLWVGKLDGALGSKRDSHDHRGGRGRRGGGDGSTAGGSEPMAPIGWHHSHPLGWQWRPSGTLAHCRQGCQMVWPPWKAFWQGLEEVSTQGLHSPILELPQQIST